MPKVTVLMPVYNGEKFLAEAITSILNQTFRGFEFLIIDDGSTDRSPEIINSFSDPRIKLITHSTNRGLIESLNNGMRLAAGEYIAQMHCDDLCHPMRLQKQLDFLEENSKISVLGTFAGTFGAGVRKLKPPVFHDQIKVYALFDSPMIHPSILIRRKVLPSPVFSPEYIHAEDYELWTRLLLEGVIFHNLPEFLLDYRVHGGQITSQSRMEQKRSADKIRAIWLRELDIQTSPGISKIHRFLAEGLYDSNEFDPKLAAKVLESLWQANLTKRMFDSNTLFSDLSKRSRDVFLRGNSNKRPRFREFKRNSLFSWIGFTKGVIRLYLLEWKKRAGFK